MNIEFLGYRISNTSKEVDISDDKGSKKIIVNNRPSSKRETPYQPAFNNLSVRYREVQPEFNFEVIKLIRKLVKVNPDMSQALNDFVKLANTGHKITFDPTVGADQVDEMREFLNNTSLEWHVGAAGIDGVVNKMFRQIMVTGSLSTEWVPNMDLSNIDNVIFVPPENIRFIQKKTRRFYHPYQKLDNGNIGKDGNNLKKLNTNQYKYFALNGDSDLPYGIPPYIGALEAIDTQGKMLDNIKTIIEMMGILGYLDAKIDKPEQEADESPEKYKERLLTLLTDFKDRLQEGLRDGVSVGFIDDHEFDFKSAAKSADGVKELFEQNELLVSSGLGYDSIFMGRPGATETLVSIMFTKMLAQLTNIQKIVSVNLEFGYKLALTLAGYKFNTLKVAFNRSTITDDLKYQQAQEILRRNLALDYDQGLISQEQFADALGYVKPDKPEPRVSRDAGQNPSDEAAKKQDREKKKDASDRRSRDKKNPQGTRKRQANNGHTYLN